jgi:hypothetical protein
MQVATSSFVKLVLHTLTLIENNWRESMRFWLLGDAPDPENVIPASGINPVAKAMLVTESRSSEQT